MRTISPLECDVRHEVYLAATLDPFSVGRLTGLPDLAGARCLELGAGGSAVPVWLADRVGPMGEVVAAGGDPRRVAAHPRIRTLAHDARVDPVPTGPFRLIRARLLLMGLPNREVLLRRLADALPAGGTLVVEDWYLWLDDAILAAPSARDARLFARYRRLLIEEILPEHGVDPAWAARLHAAMRAAGLTTVDTTIHAPVWTAGDPGALLVTVDLARFRSSFLDAGLTPGELDRLHQLVADPDSGLVLRGHLLFSTMGHKP
ncbi:methyltransferase domain-containing protein [Phytohabitans rumicis]|uniref:methyltransferase domain-containing protein n=1 Tax=Phytohabitans rumicis TaxID=1076125 RepID=UPI0031F1A6F1